MLLAGAKTHVPWLDQVSRKRNPKARKKRTRARTAAWFLTAAVEVADKHAKISGRQFTILFECLWRKTFKPGTNPNFNNQGNRDGLLHLQHADDAASKVAPVDNPSYEFWWFILDTELCRTVHVGCWIAGPKGREGAPHAWQQKFNHIIFVWRVKYNDSSRLIQNI